MQQMLQLRETEILAMGQRSRDLAVRWFGRDRFVGDYEELYRALGGSGSSWG